MAARPALVMTGRRVILCLKKTVEGWYCQLPGHLCAVDGECTHASGDAQEASSRADRLGCVGGEGNIESSRVGHRRGRDPALLPSKDLEKSHGCS